MTSHIDSARSLQEMDEAELALESQVAESSSKSPTAAASAPAKVIVVSEDEPFTEDEIIRRKLMFDGDGGGDDRRLNILMKSFFIWNRTEPGPEKEVLYNRILFLLDDAELSMRKSRMVQEMNGRELKKYESLTKELDIRIEGAKSEIQRVKEDLMQAKNVRKNRMEYDPIVAQIKQLPSRKESVEKIERMKSQAKMLTEKRDELDRRLELRKQQYQQLAYLAGDLQVKLNQDETLALEDLPDEGPVEPPSVAFAVAAAGDKRKTEPQ